MASTTPHPSGQLSASVSAVNWAVIIPAKRRENRMYPGDFVCNLSSHCRIGYDQLTWFSCADNLHYAFSTCAHGHPSQVGNYSSPCIVTCSSLAPALDSQLVNPDPVNLFDWCSSSAFAGVVVDQCTFCYNLTTNQAYLANCGFHVVILPCSNSMQWLTDT